MPSARAHSWVLSGATPAQGWPKQGWPLGHTGTNFDRGAVGRAAEPALGGGLGETAAPFLFSRLKRPQGLRSRAKAHSSCVRLCWDGSGWYSLPCTCLAAPAPPRPTSTLPGSLSAARHRGNSPRSSPTATASLSAHAGACFLPTPSPPAETGGPFQPGRPPRAGGAPGWAAGGAQRVRAQWLLVCSAALFALNTPPGGCQLPGDPLAIGSPRHVPSRGPTRSGPVSVPGPAPPNRGVCQANGPMGIWAWPGVGAGGIVARQRGLFHQPWAL